VEGRSVEPVRDEGYFETKMGSRDGSIWLPKKGVGEARPPD
jgi:hypothetical protein